MRALVRGIHYIAHATEARRNILHRCPILKDVRGDFLFASVKDPSNAMHVPFFAPTTDTIRVQSVRYMRASSNVACDVAGELVIRVGVPPNAEQLFTKAARTN